LGFNPISRDDDDDDDDNDYGGRGSRDNDIIN
jgi:hypothetical protein